MINPTVSLTLSKITLLSRILDKEFNKEKLDHELIQNLSDDLTILSNALQLQNKQARFAY